MIIYFLEKIKVSVVDKFITARERIRTKKKALNKSKNKIRNFTGDGTPQNENMRPRKAAYFLDGSGRGQVAQNQY